MDDRWNSNTYNVDRLELLRKRYKWPKPFNFEEQILIERDIGREFQIQIAALVLFSLLLVLAICHFYLCFLITLLHYRKHIVKSKFMTLWTLYHK